MPGAKYTETYKKVSAMGEKLKAAGKQGPSNDEQLNVCLQVLFSTSDMHRRADRPAKHFNLQDEDLPLTIMLL